MPYLPGSGRLILLGVIVLVGAVFLAGCGGSDEPASKPDSASESEAAAGDEAAGGEAASAPTSEEGEAASEESGEHEAAPAPAPAPKKSGEHEASPAPAPAPKKSGEHEAAPAPKNSGEHDVAPAPKKEAPKPAPAAPAAPQQTEQAKPRPADAADWTEEDLRKAKEDRDPKLLSAVAYLGENRSGDADAVKLLVELLTTPEDPEPEPKPEPKVEKKPEKKPGGEEGYDEYGGEEGAMYGDEMEHPGPPPEDEMYGDEGYPGEEEMYPEEEGSGQRRQKKGAVKTPLAACYVSLIGGIVRALGANDTKQARTVLEQILGGKIPTGNDRAAVGAVLRTLVDYPSEANDAILKKTLTSPESYRQSGEKMAATLKQLLGGAVQAQEGEKGPDIDAMVAASLADKVTAEDIRDTSLPLIEQSASMRLRYDLAAYLIGKPSEELGPRIQELVTVTNPLNLQAQIGLYRYPKTPPEMRDAFERYFTSYASCTLGRMFGVSTDEGADLPETMSTGGVEGTPAKKGWSGFGDSTEGAKNSSGRGGQRSPEEPGMDEEESYNPPEEMSSEMDHPGPPESSEYEGESSDYNPEGGPGRQDGSAQKPPSGPGEADQESVRKFDEVAAGDPNLPYELAKQLWGNELGAALAARMNALSSLEDGAQLVMLAGHIPTDAMRAQLLKTLQAHWTDGPQAFASASVSTEEGISDPGFISILKLLPRREPPARASKTEPSKEQSAQYAWMQTAYGTVRVFCERFQKAAENQQVNSADVVANLPFRIHSPDALTHVYAMDWQKQVGSRLAGAPVDPMRVYYLRFEESGLYNKVSGAYKRVVPSGSERLVKNGLWIDGGKPDHESGLRTTMDVIIDRPEYSAERKPNEPEQLVVQVLYVQIKDPGPAKPKTAEQP